MNHSASETIVGLILLGIGFLIALRTLILVAMFFMLLSFTGTGHGQGQNLIQGLLRDVFGPVLSCVIGWYVASRDYHPFLRSCGTVLTVVGGAGILAAILLFLTLHS